MFTGIVQEMGEVTSVRRHNGARSFSILANFAKDLRVGDSINVSGICLTIISVQPPIFEVEAVEETISRTNLRSLRANDKVNLERALSVTERIGGHFVQGHIDGTGVISQIRQFPRSRLLRIRCHKDLSAFMVEKGSIAVDGVSLTIVDCGANWFTTSVILYTLRQTTLGLRKVGDVVNLEVDILAKYVQRLLGNYANRR